MVVMTKSSPSILEALLLLATSALVAGMITVSADAAKQPFLQTLASDKASAGTQPEPLATLNQYAAAIVMRIEAAEGPAMVKARFLDKAGKDITTPYYACARRLCREPVVADDSLWTTRFSNAQRAGMLKARTFSSELKTFAKPRKADRLVLKQTPAWNNWEKIPSVKPAGASNAPIFLPVADGEYYFFACRGRAGYNAWHSADMKTWTHYGLVAKSRWATSAEYKDGTFYIYYDQPNDGKPHLVMDTNIKDRELGEHVGVAFDDPTGGSDCGVFRDEDGTFHIIYENWSPVNAKQHSWDSPLAGHVDSPDGIRGFVHDELPPPVDERPIIDGTKKKRYRKHETDAYGDWTIIKVGSQYYLFGDYDSTSDEEKSMRVACFTSSDINSRFTRVSEIGENLHPDPTVGFAEGRFYLIVQNRKGAEQYDFASPGPWVDGVEARAGVDTDGDGAVDQRTSWQKVKEAYRRKPGFARVIESDPAALDLSSLPAGRGFRFECRLTRDANDPVQAVLDRADFMFQQGRR
jgi:hypothetical protein